MLYIDYPKFSIILESRASEYVRNRIGTGGVDGSVFKRPIKGSYPAIMLDGLELGKMTIVAAMGIDKDGKKHVLG